MPLQSNTACPLKWTIVPGNRKVYMFKSEEEIINVVIGEALLSLLDDDAEVSSETLSARLKQMLRTETCDARRQAIKDAILETGGYLNSAVNGALNAVRGSSANGKRFSGQLNLH